jgi:hypothetical protein
MITEYYCLTFQIHDWKQHEKLAGSKFNLIMIFSF